MTSVSSKVDLSASVSLAALQSAVDARRAAGAEQGVGTQREFERQTFTLGMALVREILGADFEWLDVDADRIEFEGQSYRRRKGKTPGTYDTLAGKVTVARSTYRARGGHGGETLVPLELRLGMVDRRWTLEAAQVASGFIAETDSVAAAQLLASVGGLSPSPAHLDRLPKFLHQAWQPRRAELEDALRQRAAEKLPHLAGAVLILVSLDGIMVPMKDAPRTPGAGKEDRGPKGYQEAASGVLVVLDEARQRRVTIVLGRMPESSKASLHAQLEAELTTLLQHYPQAKVQAVADGAAENWRILEAIGAKLHLSIVKVLDYFHAVEHIAVALRTHAGRDRSQAQYDIEYWSRRLREEPKGVQAVLQALKYRRSKAHRPADQEDIQKQINYIDSHKDMMHYAQYRAEGLVIGSGIQEATCKSLIAERMKRSGMSWRQTGGQGVLTLRAWQQSGRSKDAWEILGQIFRKEFKVVNLDQEQEHGQATG